MTPAEPAFASPVDYDVHGRYDSSARLSQARAKARNDADAIASLNAFRNRIGGPASAFAAEAGRYHLYLARGCPFCHRIRIAVALLGLEHVVPASFVDDARDGRGWAFREAGGPDPVNGFTLLVEAYRATDPGFDGHISVPVLWDRSHRRIVSTESGDILVDLATQFASHASPWVDLYPASLREQVDALNAQLHQNVNFGVYLAGLAQTQASYDTAIARLFDMLDLLDVRLASRRYLFGDSITLSDIRLWVTLARFDVSYYPIFRANLKRLVEYPHLWRYARDLYRIEAFGGTTDFAQYKADYVRNFPQLTPTGILPAGPVADWSAP